MDSTTVWITVAIAVPIVVLATWIWSVVQRVDRDFRTELQGIHFDI